MDQTKIYHQFRIEVWPAPDSNDFEVRFFGDGEDIISHYWNDMIGLDPVDIFGSPCPLEATTDSRRVTVVRCDCGVIGCGSIEVNIQRIADNIKWKWGDSKSPQSISFHAASYDAEIERALKDTTWETPDRTAARLLANQVDRQTLATHGLTYSGGTGRIRKESFTVSLQLMPGPYQLLVHLPWIGDPPGVVAGKFAHLLRQSPASWEVEWFPQQVNLGPPSLAGPNWRRSDR